MSSSAALPALRDLQGLLRESLGKDVVVIDYQTSMLLAKGENYSSTMLKVDALVKKTKCSPEEEMHFVAKMIPIDEFQVKHMKMTASFKKEIFVIHQLGSMYRQLESESGVKEEDLIDVFPKFYGGRLTKSEETPDEVDADAVMLMENLKVRGYDTMDRFHGVDFEHAHLVMKEYARFHALGTALRIKKPELWETVREPINSSAYDLPDDEFDDVAEHTVELLCSDPRINKYGDRIRRSITTNKSTQAFLSVEENEPWISIVHGDGWVNNILFHHADNGKVDGVKFVDYQITRMCTPMKDLLYFLCTSTNADVMNNHFDELLDMYHLRFVDVLAKTGCDVSPFTEESFTEELNRVAKAELFHCIAALKFITKEVQQDTDLSDVKSSVMLGSADKLFFDRSWQIVSKFVEKDWI